MSIDQSVNRLWIYLKWRIQKWIWTSIEIQRILQSNEQVNRFNGIEFRFEIHQKQIDCFGTQFELVYQNARWLFRLDSRSFNDFKRWVESKESLETPIQWEPDWITLRLDNSISSNEYPRTSRIPWKRSIDDGDAIQPLSLAFHSKSRWIRYFELDVDESRFRV